MNKEHDEILQNTFPWLKRPEKTKDYDRNLTLYKNYGFECSDGWFQLLYDLNKEIADRYAQEGKEGDLKIEQIKSKWAHLCFYYSIPGHADGIQAIDGIGGAGIRFYPESDGNELYKDIAQIVDKYEHEISGKTCEWCGQPGTPRKGSWVYTLCDSCYEQHTKTKIKNANISVLTERLWITKPTTRTVNIINEEYLTQIAEAGEFEEYYGAEFCEETKSVIDLNQPLFFLIYLCDRQTYIGYVGFTGQEDDEIFLEFYIFTEYRNRGYATEALQAILDRLFDNRFLVEEDGKPQIVRGHRVLATVREDNEISKHILENLGFKRNPDGEYVDLKLSIIAPEVASIDYHLTKELYFENKI